MSKSRILPVALCVGMFGCGEEQEPSLELEEEQRADAVSRYVDPFIGTNGPGNTFPGATLPWGLVSASPHTRFSSPLDLGRLTSAGYVDEDPRVHGFGLTHLSGAGCPDLGAPVIAVTTGAVATRFEDYGAQRTGERARPGYYSVELVEPRARVELTATTRAAALRLLAGGDNLNVLIDAARSLSWTLGPGRVHVVSGSELEGEVTTGAFCAQANRQTVYFVARFSRPAAAFGTWKNDRPSAATDASGLVGGWFQFPSTSGRTVELHVGVSYVSIAGARRNLEAEIGSAGFDELRRAAQARWEEALGRVRVEGGTEEASTIFYTALYHSLLHPSVASDVDGSYRAFGGGTGRDPEHTRYHVFSLWDTYRTLHPLLALLYPERNREMARSLLGMTVEAGVPPKWELAGSEVQMMAGDPVDIVLAESAVHGLLPDGELAARAWPILQAAALDTSAPLHRPGNDLYRQLGYIPMEASLSVWGPVSTTLEYALADFALARLGQALAAPVDPALARQAQSWRSVLDPGSQLFRPRWASGAWLAPFLPDALWGSALQPRSGGPGFVEGSAWHYAFAVPHAVRDHAAASGGDAAYVARLQSLFDSGRFAMWNEPDIDAPYRFTHFAGQGFRTAAAVSEARTRWWSARHDGLPGNDDGGALSAWYVFSALGIYPDAPAGDDYAIGTPLFDRASFTLGNGRFAIDAVRSSPSARYVRSATLAGRDTGQRLRRLDIIPGASLRLVLSDTP